MQSFVINNPVVSTLSPISASVRATLPTPAPRDLQSTLPPVQPAEPSSASVSDNDPADNLYNRFARLTSEFLNSGSGSDSSVASTFAGTERGTTRDEPVLSDRFASTSQVQFSEAIEAGDNSSQQANTDGATDQESSASGESTGPSESGLTKQQLAEVRELAARDREVRSHEQAHVAVGGQYTGAPQYSLQKGPDGVSYAVGGEVSIDVGVIPGDPQATILKMQQVKRAALAPANPSPQDRAVSAQASQSILQARAELSQQQSNETTQAGRVESQPSDGSDLSEPFQVEGEAVQVYQELADLDGQASKLSDSSRILNQII